MVKSNNKKILNLKISKKTKKKTLRELIETKITSNSKKFNKSLVSRIKLFEEIQKNYKKKSKNLIKFFLKKTLTKLIEEKILIKHRESYRFSKVYLKKKLFKKTKALNKLKKLKIIPKTASNLVPTNNKSKNKNIKKAIKKLNNKLNQKLFINKFKTTKPILKKTKIKGFIYPKTSSLLFSNPAFVSPSVNSKTSPSVRIYPAIWQYYDNSKFTTNKSADDWYDYDAQASDIVEESWLKYIVNRGLNDVRSVKSGEWEYMVDFMNWNQQNILHSDHRKREIRRLDENGKVTKNPYEINSSF